MPPSGMRLVRTSTTRPRSAKRLRNGSLSDDVMIEPRAHQLLDRARTERALLGVVADDFLQTARRCGSAPAADREFRRTAGSSKPAAGPCRRPRCPGARGRARSAEFRGCSGSRRWRRRAASARPWSRPCACAAAATARAATTRRRSPRRADARHSASARSRPPRRGSRLMRRAAAKLSNDVPRALFAEIAGDRRCQFLDRHRRAPQPEARRHRREMRRHEQRRPASARSGSARGGARSRYRPG